MRILELTSNQNGFHPVKFNRTGLSLIIGKQTQTEGFEERTYNGVGKSLTVFLIDFCLASDIKADQTVVKALEGWEFSLRFEVAGVEYISSRSFSDPTIIKIGDEEITPVKFRDKFQPLIFPNTDEKKYLKFRGLLSQFLRPKRDAYSNYNHIQRSEKPIQVLLRSAYLLGLELELIYHKFELRLESEKIKAGKDAFQQDPILKEYFEGKKDIALSIDELREKTQKLEQDVSNFKVAENYSEVEETVGRLKKNLQQARNRLQTLNSQLIQIVESMKVSPDLQHEEIRSLYDKIGVNFGEAVERQFEEVEQFHSQLNQMRAARLKKDKKSIQIQIKSSETTLSKLEKDLDENLRFLNEFGALGEYLSLADTLAQTRQQLKDLEDYKQLKKKYQDRERELKLEMSQSHIDAQNYLDQNYELIESIRKEFKAIVRKIYDSKSAGIIIENNEGTNQSRYNIDAKIEADSSDGINEAKIFAYDLLLVSRRVSHSCKFVFHDSRLFSDIDPRQTAKIFEVAHSYSREKDFQYIASANQNQILDIADKFSSKEVFEDIKGCVVLELSDESPESKLLGFDVELEYD